MCERFKKEVGEWVDENRKIEEKKNNKNEKINKQVKNGS